MQFRDPGDNRQAKAAAGNILAGQSCESLQYAFALIARDTRSLVAHFEHTLLRRTMDADVDIGAARGIAHGVVDEIARQSIHQGWNCSYRGRSTCLECQRNAL